MVHREFIHINGQNRFILLGAPMSTVVTGITLDVIPLQDVKYFDAIGKWQNGVEDNNWMAILQFLDQNKKYAARLLTSAISGLTPAGNVILNNEF